ncbi:GAF domain-containing protein [Arthrobacter sp. JZ12]|uniref:sensor histidine kinase n=1 Tax=Arthrobacter sp. JZ12 TaxID=2654190 RepID=UPI002B468578|nr:GAF domain-containing sensor histidine kinase [Arthrobacter sp. JZ12]WRH23802.1 GAF domain-containing protein [Arthrobacter sp. JZ12]
MTAGVTDLTETQRLVELERYNLPGTLEDRKSTYYEDLDNLVTLAAQVCGVPFSVINVITADEQHQIAAQGIDPDVCSREDSMCAQVFRHGRTVIVEDCRDDPRFRNNPFVTGEIADVRFYASTPLITRDGHSLGTLCVFDQIPGTLTEQQRRSLEILADQIMDILDLQLRTRQLSRALAELGRSNQLLGEFAGRVSHDLQGPLTSIRGFAEMVQSDLQDDPDSRQYLDRIVGSAARMASMIDDLLDFARAGGILRVQPVSLARVTAAVQEDLSSALTGSNAQVYVDDFVAEADPSQLHVMLQNLLQNSLNYRHPEREPRIRITASGEFEHWLLEFADNGVGIAPQDRQRALEPLVRLEGSAVEGTGLGLATCSRIAQAHGGRLELDETEGGGLTVRVWFGSEPSSDPGHLP